MIIYSAASFIRNPTLLKILIIIQLLIMTFFSFKTQAALIQISISDKVIHFFAYAIMTLWLHLLFSSKNIFFKSIILLFIYGLIIEFVQYFIPGRSFSIMDVVANFLGIFCVCYVGKKIKL